MKARLSVQTISITKSVGRNIQVINNQSSIANDTPFQLPTFRHEVMPSSQSHQVGQTPTRSHQGNEGGTAAQNTNSR